MRVVFFGNSESAFSNRHYAALRAAPCTVAAVVDAPPAKRASTNPTAPTTNFVADAQAAGIPTGAPASPNTADCVASLAALAPDLFVAVGYTNLLKSALLQTPRLLAVNFHASLLPAYRGRHPLYWALKNGEKAAGLTVHLMDEGFDTGDILYQAAVPIEPADTVASLYERVMDASTPLVERLIRDAAAGALVRTPQGAVGASYYGRISQESSLQAVEHRLKPLLQAQHTD